MQIGRSTPVTGGLGLCFAFGNFDRNKEDFFITTAGTWESINNLQFYCGRLDFKHLYVKRKLTFLRALCDLDNLVVL